MSRLAMLAAAGLYLLAAFGPTVPPHMRLVLVSYAIANGALSYAV